MSELPTTPISLPQSTLFPVEITSILVASNEQVKKHDTILRYKYWHKVKENREEDDEEGEKEVEKEFHSTFEAPVSGTIQRWEMNVGDQITTAKNVVLYIEEPCPHTVQYGGLCALCGKAPEDQDYSGFNLDRAPVAMSHGTSSVKVSMDEAQRIEKNSGTRLLEAKKLILVVDLDQTVIHADVDKTIGEWMADENNPNHEAVKDVKTFELYEDVMNNQTRQISKQLCTYYVKLRPGLKEFLQELSEIYEMHVYTMAKREYARHILQLIDPEGKFFADRVLSRDDNGNAFDKQLKRLFPVSTTMVAIIDDRGDVWKWSPHLLKVVPYNFFRIGDINSSFLPQRQGVVEPPKAVNPVDLENKKAKKEEAEEAQESQPANPDNGPEAKEEAKVERSEILGAQINERPLAKLEEKQWEKEEREAEKNHEQPVHQQVLLADEDKELESVKRTLKKVHEQYYKQYDPKSAQEPDVKDIMQKLKEPVFGGCVFLFSGIVPLGVRIDNADIVRWVRSFGATVVAEYIDSVTHVITNNPGTKKVQQAARNKDVKIVTTGWVFKCMENWERVVEDDYLLDVVPIAGIEAEDKNGEEDPDVDAEQFMKRLNEGNVDWDEINKEVEDFLGSDDDEEDEDDDDEEEDDEEGEGNDTSNTNKRSRPDEDEDETDQKPSSAKRPRAADDEAATTNGTSNEPNDSNDFDDDYDEDEFAKELEDGLL